LCRSSGHQTWRRCDYDEDHFWPDDTNLTHPEDYAPAAWICLAIERTRRCIGVNEDTSMVVQARTSMDILPVGSCSIYNLQTGYQSSYHKTSDTSN
jgi:hypothetical protein